jgi:hypothetical protein
VHAFENFNGVWQASDISEVGSQALGSSISGKIVMLSIAKPRIFGSLKEIFLIFLGFGLCFEVI